MLRSATEQLRVMESLCRDPGHVDNLQRIGVEGGLFFASPPIETAMLRISMAAMVLLVVSFSLEDDLDSKLHVKGLARTDSGSAIEVADGIVHQTKATEVRICSRKTLPSNLIRRASTGRH